MAKDVQDLPLRKLRGAQRSLEELAWAWDSFRSTERVSYEPIIDLEALTVTYRAKMSTAPPVDDLEWRLRAAVQDARSSLDNLIWQLGERHKVPRNVAKSNAFPIVSDDADWNTKGKGRLRRLPPGVVQRVRTVQPGSPGQATFEGAAHPLEFLRDASNADKHHASFRMVLAPAPPPGQHLLTTLTLQLPKEQAELVEKAIRTIKADVDKWMDIHTGPVLDGTIVLTLRLPPGYDYEFIWADAVDLPLSLGAELTDPSGVGPIIPEMENAIRFAREAVQYIAGTTASAPAPFGEADMALIKAAQPETVQE